MSVFRNLDMKEMENLLAQAKASRAPASIRAVGGVRLLGDLHLSGFEIGGSLQFSGAKHRDLVPAKGTMVVVSVLLGEEIYALQTRMLGPVTPVEPDSLYPPAVRVDWPQAQMEVHCRGDVRVATLDLPPLTATLVFKDRVYAAKLLNLTETGMGLGLTERLLIDLHAQVEVETELPGGVTLRTTGNVRHLELLDEDPLPTRLGLVLGCMTDQTRESLRRFIQARRTDRSEKMRNEH